MEEAAAGQHDHDGDVIKANMCLAGVIGVFMFLTFIAYLLNEGQRYCVIPILRKIWPKCKWVARHDKLDSDEYDKTNIFLVPHIFGKKKIVSKY